VTSEDSSSTKISTRRLPRPSDALLALTLIASAALVYAYRLELPDERRLVLALAAIGLFFASPSSVPIRLGLFFPLVAALGWGGRLAASGTGGFWWWLVCAVVGAYASIRAGGRALAYYLPAASGSDGEREQSSIRRNLQLSVILFLVIFVQDAAPPRWPWLRAAGLFLSATFFLRYLLLQSKYLRLASRSLDFTGLVPTQRWPLLVLMLAFGATPYLNRWLPGSDPGPLLVSSMLLLVTAALLFALALPRLGWPKAAMRKASFLGGMGLAVALAAALVELEAWGPSRFTFFMTLCTGVLVILPFVHHTTRLFHDYPRLGTLIMPGVVSVMSFPVTAINGPRLWLGSSGFLFAFALQALVYHLVVVVRQRRSGALYLASSLAILGFVFLTAGTSWGPNGSAWKMFTISFCFVLYAVDLLDRAHRVAKPTAP